MVGFSERNCCHSSVRSLGALHPKTDDDDKKPKKRFQSKSNDGFSISTWCLDVEHQHFPVPLVCLWEISFSRPITVASWIFLWDTCSKRRTVRFADHAPPKVAPPGISSDRTMLRPGTAEGFGREPRCTQRPQPGKNPRKNEVCFFGGNHPGYSSLPGTLRMCPTPFPMTVACGLSTSPALADGFSLYRM